MIFDLADMPHLLMAGRTGTGKSVCLNAMILSILMTKRPDEVKMILIDPKKVELSQYKRIPHLMHPVVTDMKKAESILAWACEKMDERYEFLRRAEVRNIQAYNRLGAQEIYTRLAPEDDEERKRIPTYMPYIVIIADELAEIMMTAEKEVEQHIVRLAQLARAVGVHLILATQKPVVDVVTGLDQGQPAGADRVSGDQPQRLAGRARRDGRRAAAGQRRHAVLDSGHVAHHSRPGHVRLGRRGQPRSASTSSAIRSSSAASCSRCRSAADRPAKNEGQRSRIATSCTSRRSRSSSAKAAVRARCLQRALGIGYGRAARLIDFMAEDGIVGEFKSGSAREVLYNWEEWEALKNGGEGKGDARGVRKFDVPAGVSIGLVS